METCFTLRKNTLWDVVMNSGHNGDHRYVTQILARDTLRCSGLLNRVVGDWFAHKFCCNDSNTLSIPWEFEDSSGEAEVEFEQLLTQIGTAQSMQEHYHIYDDYSTCCSFFDSEKMFLRIKNQTEQSYQTQQPVQDSIAYNAFRIYLKWSREAIEKRQIELWLEHELCRLISHIVQMPDMCDGHGYWRIDDDEYGWHEESSKAIVENYYPEFATLATPEFVVQHLLIGLQELRTTGALDDNKYDSDINLRTLLLDNITDWGDSITSDMKESVKHISSQYAVRVKELLHTYDFHTDNSPSPEAIVKRLQHCVDVFKVTYHDYGESQCSDKAFAGFSHTHTANKLSFIKYHKQNDFWSDEVFAKMIAEDNLSDADIKQFDDGKFFHSSIGFKHNDVQRQNMWHFLELFKPTTCS